MAGHQRTADTPAGGGRADGRTPRRAADRGGALYYGWACMLTLWRKGGYGGSPNVEAGKMYQHPSPGCLPVRPYRVFSRALMRGQNETRRNNYVQYNTFTPQHPAVPLHPVLLIYISPRQSSWTPGVFYTYFYNHARRLRLEKLINLELSRIPNGFLKVLLGPGGGFTSETAARKF
jgi:hypothetical protein